MVELDPEYDGKIVIGDVDIKNLGLVKLRYNLCIIP